MVLFVLCFLNLAPLIVHFYNIYNIKRFFAGLILWQVCHLELPYKELTRKKLYEDVFCDGGGRPNIQSDQCNKSEMLISTISRCWSEVIDNRPEFAAIEKILSDEIQSYNE